MSICRSLVEGTGRQIGLDSELGKGSTFWFTVPVKALGRPDGREDAGEGSSGIAGTRVLVAEDNEINRDLVVELLAAAGVDVTVARDGREAADLCIAGDFDIVFMDCLMPTLDGFAATRVIRDRIGRRPPIVAFTANAESDIRGQCLNAGMDDVLSKPVSAPEIVTMVRRWARPSPA